MGFIGENRVLVVDDNLIAIRGYITVFENLGCSFSIDTSYHIEQAYSKITQENRHYDLVVLDMNLSPWKKNESYFFSADDMAIEFKNSPLVSKLIVVANTDNNYRINHVLRVINPDGFVLKRELSPENLFQAYSATKSGSCYYSKSIRNAMRKQFSRGFLDIDTLDIKILYHLHEGEKTKNLPKFIPLSISGIERRKRKMKFTFGIFEGGDRTLISKAREKGFI